MTNDSKQADALRVVWNRILLDDRMKLPDDVRVRINELFEEAVRDGTARPLPTVEEIAVVLNNEGAYCGDCDYESGLNCSGCKQVCHSYGRAVLALMNGVQP